MTDILRKLELYCAKWNFALGYEKCGIIQYGLPDSLIRNLPPAINLTEGSIKFMNAYKHLGCWIPNKWDKNEPYLMEQEHAKALAQKSARSFFAPFRYYTTRKSTCCANHA